MVRRHSCRRERATPLHPHRVASQPDQGADYRRPAAAASYEVVTFPRVLVNYGTNASLREKEQRALVRVMFLEGVR